MSFPFDVVEDAWYRQGGLCAHCGKVLVGENCSRGQRGGWHPHHRKPRSYGGTDLLRNCVLLCINPPNCHLYIGHGGDYRQYAVIYDYDLPYLYAGE